MQNSVRFLLMSALILGVANCATTNIQTGGNQYQPSDFGERDPETSFFNEMSEQDPAFQDNAAAGDRRLDEVEDRELTGKDCPCNATKEEREDVAIADREAEVQPRRETYYDKPAQEEQPVPEETAVENEKPIVETVEADQNFDGMGTASWYGRDFDGKPTASGEIYDSRKLTAAHKKIPLGSIVLVRNMENDKEVLVTINDRGPFVKGRIIDMSEYGAEMLGFKEQGLTTVQLKVIRAGKGRASVNRGATYDFFGPGNNTSLSDVGGADDRATQSRAQAILQQDEQRLIASQKLAASIPDASTQRGFAIQVGSFADLRNAMGMRRMLQASGRQDVQIFNRQGMYVVRVGRFDNRSRASQLLSDLVAEGYRAFIAAPQS